jgi:SAM-dependent methyltransferase
MRVTTACGLVRAGISKYSLVLIIQVRTSCKAPRRIGISEKVDCALTFYIIHEVPDQENLLKELRSTLKPEGILYIIEPRPRVSRKAFEETVKKAEEIEFKPLDRPRVFLSRAMIFRR